MRVRGARTRLGGARTHGVAIVRCGKTGIAKFECWGDLPDWTQLSFRRFLTAEERALFPLRNHPLGEIIRGDNGFPRLFTRIFMPADGGDQNVEWDVLTLDEQEAFHGVMTEEERDVFPLKEAWNANT